MIHERLQGALSARHGPAEEDGAREPDDGAEGAVPRPVRDVRRTPVRRRLGAPGLSLRDRQLVTLAANIAMARPTGNFSHYRSAEHIGITREEIIEVIIQVGHYCGWPTISNAVRQYTAVIQEEADIKAGKKTKRELV